MFYLEQQIKLKTCTYSAHSCIDILSLHRISWIFAPVLTVRFTNRPIALGDLAAKRRLVYSILQLIDNPQNSKAESNKLKTETRKLKRKPKPQNRNTRVGNRNTPLNAKTEIQKKHTKQKHKIEENRKRMLKKKNSKKQNNHKTRN